MHETIPTEIDNYTVKFMVNGKKYDTMSFEEDGKIKFPKDPYMEGYEFVCWYTEDDEPIETKYKVIIKN